MSNLNIDQQNALDRIGSFLKDKQSENCFFLLEGGAGTGKTYTIQALIKQQLAIKGWKKPRIAIAAPTHQAVKVIRSMGKIEGLVEQIEYITIQSLLGLQLKNIEDKQVLVKTTNSSVSDYDIIVIDEASMIGEELWMFLLETSQSMFSPKIIFMGDIAQINPVNESISPVFRLISESCRAQLTIIMRQAGDNPAIDLIAIARKLTNVDGDATAYRLPNESAVLPDLTQGYWFQGKSQWKENVFKAFQSKHWRNDFAFCRVIAWTNRAVNQLNSEIRDCLFPTATDPYVIGERLIAKNAIFDDAGEDIILQNRTEMEVLKVEQVVYKGFESWQLRVKPSDKDAQYTIYVLHESSIALHKAELSRLASLARNSQTRRDANRAWEAFSRLRDAWASVSYLYAITAHGAQGSTFENVFVNQGDILRNPDAQERYRVLYVACSRPSKRLILTDG